MRSLILIFTTIAVFQIDSAIGAGMVLSCEGKIFTAHNGKDFPRTNYSAVESQIILNVSGRKGCWNGTVSDQQNFELCGTLSVFDNEFVLHTESTKNFSDRLEIRSDVKIDRYTGVLSYHKRALFGGRIPVDWSWELNCTHVEDFEVERKF